jgi:hypothetical protein
LGKRDELPSGNGPVVKHCRIEVGPVRPDEGVSLVVEAHLVEKARIRERAVQFADQHWPEVDGLVCSIVEVNAERKGSDLLELLDAVDCVLHFGYLKGSILTG